MISNLPNKVNFNFESWGANTFRDLENGLYSVDIRIIKKKYFRL